MKDMMLQKLLSVSENNHLELIFRLMVGFIMLYHGFNKLQNPMGLVPFLEMKGVPFPVLGAYLAAITEFFGGLALMLGLATRLASLGLAVCMVVAIMTMGGFSAGLNSLSGGLEYQWVLLSVFTYFAVAGSGKTSLDCILARKLIR
ncbi:DoxX family protein [Thaumasiovibrio subtropicus]|uniref:DoxX family protein n=1 Tax=Thaumasiovibrio subtropicus TaxID=1891207 RepID=UPI00131BED63|nr:DoxX family protein [Thaumasiovibrio subtropicus]